MKNSFILLSICLAFSGITNGQNLFSKRNTAMLWQKCLGGSGDDVAQKMVVTNDGGTLVAGTTTSTNGNVSGNHGGGDIWIVKTSATGDIEWQKCIGGSNYEMPTDLLQTTDGGCLVSGFTNSVNGDFTGNHGGTDALVCKLSATGNLQWSICYGGSSNDTIKNIFALPGGGYLLFGNTNSNNGNISGNHGNTDTWLAQIDNNGTIQWQRCYGGSGNDNGVMLTLLNGTGYAFCALTTSNDGDVSGNTNNKTTWCVRTDAAGNLTWQKTLGTDNKDFPLGIINNLVSGVYLVRGRMIAVPINLSGTFHDRLHMVQTRDLINEANGNIISSTGINNTPVGPSNPGVFEAKFRGYQNGTHNVLSNAFKCGLQGFDGPPYLLLQKGVSFLSTNSSIYLENWRNCPSNLSTTMFHFKGYDADRTDNARELVCGTSNDDQYGLYPTTQNYDAFLCTGSGISFNGGDVTLWGGSNNDGFTIVNKVNNDVFYACGYTLSNNGFVSGNHGAQEIWLVKIAMKSNLNEIKGSVYVDMNNNNVRDAGDVAFNHGMVRSQKATPTQESNSFLDHGAFSNFVDTGTYLSQLLLASPLNGYYTVLPSSKTSAFADNNFIQKDSFDFALKPIPGKKDLRVNTTVLTPLRGGFDATYQIQYENVGTEAISTTQLQFIKDSKTSFVSSTLAGYVVNGDTISWNTGNIPPLYENAIRVVVHIPPPPAVNIGDMLSTIAQVNPVSGDETMNDNRFEQSRTVTNAYDPNDKHNQHGDEIGTAYLQSDGYIYYTIRFQNTGNDTAFNVKIIDTLAADLNMQTLEVASSSHPYRITSGTGNTLSINFPNILLPDSTENNNGSQGYILLRIRPFSAAIIPGKNIYNRVSIYFDLNPPVVTNTDSLRIKANIPRPLLGGLAASYCKDPGSLQTGRILNPSALFNISVKMDNDQVLAYNATDSSFNFNTATLNAGTHRIKVIYSMTGANADSAEHAFIIDSIIIPVITTASTVICKNDLPVNLQANTPVTWSGNGVSGNIFNPATAGAGTHQIIATKTNGTCPDSKDTLTITVDDFVQAVISNPDQTVCRFSSSISLQANTNVTWNGNGVSGNIFNPATAGAGTHQIIATKTNGTCPDSKDTLTITVDDFVQAVISNPDQTVCKSSSSVNLQANTNVTWSGNGVSGNIFNPAVAGAGTHQIIATKTNGTCPDSKDTLTITVDDFVQAVISNPDQTVCKFSSSVNLQANTNVTWNGNGVSGNLFNPAVAGAGTHQIIATKTNGTCPDSKDTLTITVDDFVQAVISTPDQTICKLSSSINLQANTNVTWSGNGVSGSAFNPLTAGTGVHTIIATKTNGTCPDSKDTLTITVDDFIRPVIGNNDTTVCILNGAFSLRSDIGVTWSGPGVTGSSFTPANAGPGSHLVIATKTNGACADGKDTVLVVVTAALTPDVNAGTLQSTLNSASETSLVTATHTSGGATPLYTFAKDRNFTQILRPESPVNTFTVTTQMLNTGINMLYVRMRSNSTCVTTTTAVDSFAIRLNVSTAPRNELEKTLKVFPNPNDGLFSFRFETGISDNVSVTVYDAAGKQVYTDAYGNVSQYYFSRIINLRNKHSGTYSILFKIGNVMITKRVNITR